MIIPIQDVGADGDGVVKLIGRIHPAAVGPRARHQLRDHRAGQSAGITHLSGVEGSVNRPVSPEILMIQGLSRGLIFGR